MAANVIKIGHLGRIRDKELVPFTRQLASMSAAGMSILVIIQTLEEQCTDAEFKKLLRRLLDRIEAGDPLSTGLNDFPLLFDEMYVNMAVAGEQSGDFAGVMKRLSQIIQSSARLKRKVKSAMTYPTVVLSLSLLLAAGLIQFVVPIFAEMFMESGKPLPALTQLMVDISNFVKSYWYLVLGGIVLVVWSFRRWVTTEGGRFKFDTFLLKLPVFGDLNIKASVGRFARMLAQMLGCGVPILRALEIVAGSMGNKVLESDIVAARAEVERGVQLNVALDGKPFMPVMMVRMIGAGEKSGRLEDMLNSVADAYDEEVEVLLNTLTSLMEPFLMVFLGIIIGTIVTAMFLPIFNMGSLAAG